MSTPVSPIKLSVYKIIREYEKTGRIIFAKEELINFANKVVKVASEIDNEDYWIFPDEEYGYDFNASLSKICRTSTDCLELSGSRYNNGGKLWAEKAIGSMPYSFLKGAVKVLEEELKEKEETKGVTCD